MSDRRIVHQVTAEQTGKRLDRLCAELFPSRSRTRLAASIRCGEITVNGAPVRPSVAIQAGDRIECRFSPPREERVTAEAIPLDLLYRDEALMVINKQAGLVVHPGAGVQRGTLVSALLHLDPSQAGVGGEGRAGLVHRLDRDTTGAMVVARTELAHRKLSEQFRSRQVFKLYHAVVWGRPRRPAGVIDQAIGRDEKQRTKMSTRSKRARPALSEWELRGELPGFAFLEVRILTGRTHQVRVHLAAMGHPIVGDAVYGGIRASTLREPERKLLVAGFRRPALHASRLAFEHPKSGQRVEFCAPWPSDLIGLWSGLGGTPP